MKSWWIAFAFLAGCAVSAAAGFWYGFREAWYLGAAAGFLPRGVIATQQLKALEAGRTDFISVGLESDVDNGLIWGYELFHHPLRRGLNLLSGTDVYPEYEKYTVRLADYRREHPSRMKEDMFDTVPPGKEQYRDFYADLAQSARESVAKMNAMVERYATKR
jgi:hypothetical protein